jgi:hypothetical protein
MQNQPSSETEKESIKRDEYILLLKMRTQTFDESGQMAIAVWSASRWIVALERRVQSPLSEATQRVKSRSSAKPIGMWNRLECSEMTSTCRQVSGEQYDRSSRSCSESELNSMNPVENNWKSLDLVAVAQSDITEMSISYQIEKHLNEQLNTRANDTVNFKSSIQMWYPVVLYKPPTGEPWLQGNILWILMPPESGSLLLISIFQPALLHRANWSQKFSCKRVSTQVTSWLGFYVNRPADEVK